MILRAKKNRTSNKNSGTANSNQQLIILLQKVKIIECKVTSNNN